MEAAALRKKRLALGQMTAQARVIKDMASFDGGAKPGAPIDPRAAVALFDRDGRATYSNIEGRRKAIRGRAHAMIDGILADHSRNVVGNLRNRAQLEDVVRELFGERTTNANAKELAGAWNAAAEMLRQRFNAAGGAIGKLKDWGVTQMHDTRLVKDAGWDAWRAYTLPKLDRDKMLDPDTGMRMNPQRFEMAVKSVYESISTDGWNERTPGVSGSRSLAAKRADHRFLVFKNADDWMAYQGKFGTGNAFDAMMTYIDGFSRDIAAMEILGPNPNATVRWLKDVLDRSARVTEGASKKAEDSAYSASRQIDRLYGEITGTAGRAENRTLSLIFSSIRSTFTAAKLGGATLSAVTDVAFQTSTRKFNGLGAASVIPQYIKLFRPGAEADQRLAVRMGLIATEWSQRTAAQGRFLNEELTGEVPRRLAEAVLRVSLLSRWTEAGRWAFGMEFLGHITEESGKGFDALHPAFRGSLERHGIDAAGWDQVRATPLEMDRGVPWIKPANIENRQLGDRVLEMILQETDFAVPTADLRTRAMLNAVAPKGTLIGEAVRSAFLFKGFGISLLLMQGRRIMEQSGVNAARYTAGLMIGTTLMGALVMQLKALAAGKDPRPMQDAPGWKQNKDGTKSFDGGFWGAAILQGGGFGLFGDFMQSTTNRYGGGIKDTMAGPLWGDAQQVVNAVKSKHPAWQWAQLAKSELPGQSLWYARTAFDRLVTDQIQEEVDPDYRASWQRMNKRAAEQHTDFWWAPGETAPERAPDMARGAAAVN